ncbi:adenylate/guanylate cyclase domain-containing protein [Bradyrhizobium neotropicale]|uniref:adenylate/guanylate cyclase domain-containing protein n=1 Tax=Bradyrhizobium neotropicale TaxID=1497615 RepID=UPI001AD61B08|nr:adenylate/guanylate cyclase domain-containing protein [Bradyrhizobium neotropicale]MBO4226145.1 tetratricopeptide repeat protein [Bradyrhizobium neotropicale]
MERERVRRRLAAILATDVAGYSRLVGADEEGTLAHFKLLHRELVAPKIAKHRGRVVKTTGDGLLAEFASVIDALRCAVEVQRCMAERNAGLPQDKRIEFRIGIHQGDIVIERGDIFGDGVNVAARLQTLAEPGGICVSARVQEDARGKFDIPLEDTGEQQLKNIARSVRVYRIRPSDPAKSSPCSSPLSDTPPMVSSPIPVFPLRLRRMLGARHVRTALMTALVLLMTSGGAAYWYLRRGEPQPQEHRLSIVVLPFTNLSNEPEQDYFAEALTDDLSADLSRIQDSFVIAPNTARAYKNVDPKRAGRELGVRYVLDGSLRRAETMVRIHARLIDARTGAEVWSERVDGDWSKSMQLQDIITGRLARRFDLELINQESRDAELARPNRPDAVDLTMRGWAVLNQPYSREQLAQSRILFERALQIDFGFPKALVGLADALAMEVNYRWSNAPADQLQRAENAVGQVLSKFPSDAMAHFVKGEILRARGRNVESAVGEYEEAIAINPSLAPAHGALGAAKIRVGRSAEAFAPLQMAIQLSPRDPLLSTWYFYICHAHSHLGQYEEAIDWCRRSIAVSALWIAYADLAAASALTGHEREARAAVAELRRLRPNYTVALWLQDGNGWSDNVTFLAEFQRIAEGLRKAGLPE